MAIGDLAAVRTARAWFSEEWTWRLFVVLQIAGVLAVAAMDVTARSNWGLLPWGDYTGWDWDLFEAYHWRATDRNWIATACLALPAAISKSVDWIVAGRAKPKP